jgi:hypothetical protein
MKKIIKATLIIGLVLGSIGALSRVATLLFGDTMLEMMERNLNNLPENYLQYKANLSQATEKTFSNIISIFGNLALILSGGTLGLLSIASYTKKTGGLF